MASISKIKLNGVDIQYEIEDRSSEIHCIFKDTYKLRYRDKLEIWTNIYITKFRLENIYISNKIDDDGSHIEPASIKDLDQTYIDIINIKENIIEIICSIMIIRPIIRNIPISSKLIIPHVKNRWECMEWG